jgi:RNA polymerase sigma-70 factor (ECF subfamily)
MEMAMINLSRESRALIDQARGAEDPTDADRARLRAAIAARIGMLTATTGALAAGLEGSAAGAGALSRLGRLGLRAKILLSVAAAAGGAALGFGYVGHQRMQTPSVTVPAPTPSAPSTMPMPAEPPPAPSASAPPTALTMEETPKPPPQAIAAEAPSGRANRGTVASTDEGEDVAAEAGLLRTTLGAIGRGDGARALDLVEEHGRRFPKGQLGAEFAAARVLALCRLGRTQEAKADADRFVRDNPRSPLVPRISRGCDSPAPSANSP